MSVLSSNPDTAKTVSPAARAQASRRRLNRIDRRANHLLKWLAIGGCAVVFVTLVGLVYQIINDASLAFSKEGFGILTRTSWNAEENQFGFKSLIFGTLVTSVVSLIGATVLGVAIGLFLSMLAPKRVAAVIGPLVELLAAIPSVVIGVLGIAVFAPFIVAHVEPFLHDTLGFIPLFGKPQAAGNSIFTACLVLTFMVLPIIASLSRDVFNTVPRELTDGAAALGSTTWEVIRGVVLPTTATGIVSACVLGFGRALGEAVAVSMVIGGRTAIYTNFFLPGDTSASRIVDEFSGVVNQLQLSVLYYLAAILLAFGIASNLAAQFIARRFQGNRA